LLSRPQTVGNAGATPREAIVEVDDDELRQEVIAAIRHLGLPLSGGFDVVVRHGAVHLWGQAMDEEDHRSYRGAAGRVPGVKDVHSHMQVMPMRWPMGMRR
jgi:osmotically-inducible protein OsmY